MLVLSRRKDESVVIDGQIVVKILEIRGNQIRLGIDAPRDVPVWRDELGRTAAAEQELAVA